MMPGEEKEEVVVLQHTTLKEGDMQGISLVDIKKRSTRMERSTLSFSFITLDSDFRKVNEVIFCSLK